MINVLSLLKEKKVLYAQNVIQLREGISTMYPQASVAERAALFSKAIHKILDSNLKHLDKDTVQDLKKRLLQKVVTQTQIDLTAYDVLETYVLSNTKNDLTHEIELKSWLISQEVAEVTDSDFEELMSYFEESVCTVESVCPTSVGNTSEQGKIIDISMNKMKWIVGVSIVLALGLILSKNIVIQTPEENLMTVEQLQSLVQQSGIMQGYEEPVVMRNHLQPHLQYKEINEHALKVWLLSRGAMLAREPYFSSIIDVAKEFYINPLLMFAITGQEQGFVKETHPEADEIANNPFNVFGSWQDFNTDIADTSRIAARTIINLSQGCPEDADPIKWLNKKYAEDPDWHKGVTSILNTLEKVAGQMPEG